MKLNKYYLNKCRVVQKDILDVFIFEGILQRDGSLHISSTAKPPKGFTFAHLERPVTGKPAQWHLEGVTKQCKVLAYMS